MFEHTKALEVGKTIGPTANPAMIRLPERISGTYWIFVVTDAENAVYEKQGEVNNAFLISRLLMA